MLVVSRMMLVLTLALSANTQVFAQNASLDEKLQELVYNRPYSDNPAKSLKEITTLVDKGAAVFGTADDPSSRALSPLTIAVGNSDEESVKILLKKKPNLNLPLSEQGETLISKCIKEIGEEPLKPEAERIVKLLLQAGANPNLPNPQESEIENSLLLAAKNHQTSLVTTLLNAGAKANAANAGGFTILHSEAASNLTILKQLLAAGAPVFPITVVGSTPLHFVCKRPVSFVDQPDPEAAQRIALLKSKDTSLDTHFPQKKVWLIATPLGEAATTYNPDCFAALIKAGASLDAQQYSPAQQAADPSTKGVTVRKSIQKWAKEEPSLYNKAIVKMAK